MWDYVGHGKALEFILNGCETNAGPQTDFLWLLGGGMDYEAVRIDVKSPVGTTVVLVS